MFTRRGSVLTATTLVAASGLHAFAQQPAPAQQRTPNRVTTPEPPAAATPPPPALTLPSAAEMKKLEEELAASRKRLDDATKAVAAHKDVHDALQKATDAAKASQELYGRLRDLQLPPAPAPPADTALRITEAKFGDRRFKDHWCDAKNFVIDKCKLNAAAGTTKHRCVITNPAALDFCGFVPSPQGENSIHIHYTCGPGAPDHQITIPASSTVIRLICDVPVEPVMATADTNTASKSSPQTPVQPAPPAAAPAAPAVTPATPPPAGGTTPATTPSKKQP